MKVYIENVFKNDRYNFFEVDDVYYILEIKPSIWKYLFPFMYWFFPFPVYKVEDEEAIKRIQTPESWSMNKSSVALSAGGFAVLVATFLRGKIDDLTFLMPLSIKIISVIFTVLCVGLIRLYITRRKYHDLHNKMNITKLEKSYVKVKPQSFKHFFQMISTYLLFLFFTVLFYVTYFPHDNFFLLFAGSVFLLSLTFASNITVKEGWTPIKFINK